MENCSGRKEIFLNDRLFTRDQGRSHKNPILFFFFHSFSMKLPPFEISKSPSSLFQVFSKCKTEKPIWIRSLVSSKHCLVVGTYLLNLQKISTLSTRVVCVCVCMEGRYWVLLIIKHGLCIHCLPNTFAVSVRNFILTSLVFSYHLVIHYKIFGDSDGKESACNMGDTVSISGLGRSLEKGMAPHSSVLAWRTPCTEESGGLQSVQSQESDMT